MREFEDAYEKIITQMKDSSVMVDSVSDKYRMPKSGVPLVNGGLYRKGNDAYQVMIQFVHAFGDDFVVQYNADPQGFSTSIDMIPLSVYKQDNDDIEKFSMIQMRG